MFDAQLGPENDMGLTKKIEPFGTTKVDASSLQADNHAASNACSSTIYYTSVNLKSTHIAKQMIWTTS